MRAPRVVVAGLRGGNGKTLVAIGLEAAWRNRNLRVAPLKKGPDFIDAAWATAAAGRPCRNLDLFLFQPEVVRRSFGRAAADADVAVIEGNRGLFDGLDARGSCSTAELAKLLDAPVLLVVDCTKATRTVAASVLGCQALDPDLTIGGVVLNRVAGGRHEAVVRGAVVESTGIPVLGVLPRLEREILPERHLGLVPPPENSGRSDPVGDATDLAARFLNLDAILTLATRAPAFVMPSAGAPPVTAACPAGSVRIGIFRDEAFTFYYPENLEALVQAGARLLDISPLRDRELPEVDALYIGGGFPETLAPGLADNGGFREAVRRAAEAGLPIYAECGGAVFLGRTLAFRGGHFPMASVLPVHFGFREQPQGHGYTVLETVAENPFFPVGTDLRGHEFHHTYMESAVGEPMFAFRVQRGRGFDGRDGLCHRNVLACYTHVHALGAQEWAPALVRAALRYRDATAPAAAGLGG